MNKKNERQRLLYSIFHVIAKNPGLTVDSLCGICKNAMICDATYFEMSGYLNKLIKSGAIGGFASSGATSFVFHPSDDYQYHLDEADGNAPF